MKRAIRIFAFVTAVMIFTSVFSAGAFSKVSSKQPDTVRAWSTSPVCAGLNGLGVLDKIGVTLGAVSSRVTITPTASGSQIRLLFSNEYGLTPLTVSACTVARTGKNAKTVDCKTFTDIKFNNNKYAIIPAGQSVYSDFASFKVTAGEKITVTTYFRGINTQRTIGLIGGESFVAVGNYTRSRTMTLGIPLVFSADSGSYEIIPSLTGVDVIPDEETAGCVIFGDSTVANELPRLLEKRLLDNGIANISVTQQAIKGNRLLSDGVGAAAKLLGEAGIDRFERDVLEQPGVKYVIVKLGANDIIHPHCKSKADKLTPVSFEEMKEGYIKLVSASHDRGIKIFFAEITPWKGYTRNVFGMGDDVEWTEEIDSLRIELNNWFSGKDCPADGYIPFPGLKDSTDEYRLVPSYTTDGVHFTPEGQQAMADQIPLNLFTKKHIIT